MSNNSTIKKKGNRLNWFIGIIVSILAAGGGLVALLEYNDSVIKEENEVFQRKMVDWKNFSPHSISHGVQDAEILGGWYIDIDKGQVGMSMIGSSWDLQFNIDQRSFEGLRANEGVEWSPLGVVDLSSISYREIRDAKYLEPRHLDSRPKKKDDKYLYLSHITSTPVSGYAFTLKTSAKNIALIQIHEYIKLQNGSRKLVLRYEVFPIESDPPKPKK